MFIVECLPFSRGLNAESLSYFYSTYLEPGSLVKVTIRGKSVSALVINSKDAVESKSEIKSASFQLKKVTSSSGKPFLEKDFLKAVNETAVYFATTPGAILSHLIPSFVLENPKIIASIKKTEDTKKEQNKPEVLVLQASNEERFDNYRSLIREEFAKKKSIFLCLPQNEDIKQIKEKLGRGIESYVTLFHKDMTKKELKEEWEKACSMTHPILIVGTARWLLIPRSDLGTIIIDKENESGWKTIARPFIDLRFFAELYAKKKNIRCIIGDSFLRIETLYRHKQQEISQLESIKWRLTSDVKTYLIDLKELTKKEKDFRIVSKDLLELIKETTSKGAHMFIFAARKGLSPITICRDCGEQVKCSNCSSAMILYKTKDGGLFRCPQCGETRDASEVCQKCSSWKLAAYGVGIDRVSEEIRQYLPDVNLFEINKDIAETGGKAMKIMESFYDKRGAVLLGTEIAFAYLSKKVSASAIASLDSLFFIPDYKIREKIFRLILQTKNIAKDSFLIQTRNPEDPTVELAISGNLLEFYTRETEDRKVLEYPPYGIFIKVTARGTKNFVTKETENLKKLFAKIDQKNDPNDEENYGNPKDYKITFFGSSQEKKGEQAAVNAVVKLPRSSWPHQQILSVLKSLPPHFEIKVDPDNLL